MKREELAAKINSLGKAAFTVNDLRFLFPKNRYLSTTLRRLVRAGFIRAITRSVYALGSKTIEPEKLAQQLYYPGYTSFETALARYGIINQGPNILTLATIKHAKKMVLDNTAVEFRHLKPELFFGFNLLDGLYLAEPEKALLDTLYFIALGKKKLSLPGWYLEGLDKTKLYRYLKSFPSPVKKLLDRIKS